MHSSSLSRLTALRQDLLSRRAERPIIERHADPMDTTVALEDRSRIAGDRHREAQQLKAIDMALLAIQEGTYGTCARCEEEIPARRLEAVVTALTCVRCAEIIEAEAKSERGWEAA